MAIRFSLAGNAGERGFEAQVDRAVEMETLGYEGIFFSESLMSGLDPFQVLTVAALRTSRIKLGTAIMTMTFREPVVLANQAATLNEISEGRAILGLGTGDGTTYTMARTAMPLERFATGVRMIRELVNGRTIHVPEGKEREAGDLPLRAGRFPVPVWVAAAGPRALRTAGKVADGVILGSGFDLRVVDWAKEQIAQGAREVGRDPDEIELIGAGIVCVDDEPIVLHSLREQFERELVAYEIEVAEGAAAVAIVETARRREVGLIVVGTRGLARATRAELGSVARRVATDADCSVRVARPRAPLTGPQSTSGMGSSVGDEARRPRGRVGEAAVEGGTALGGERTAREYDTVLLAALPLSLDIRAQTDAGKPTVAADPEGRIAAVYRDAARHMAARLWQVAREASAAPTIDVLED